MAESPDISSEQESPLSGALPVFALVNLAVAQPLLDLMSRQAAFLVAHKLLPSEILLLAVGLSWLLPLVLIAAVALLRLASTTAARLFHRFLLFGLLGLLSLLVLKKAAGIPGVALIAAALATAALALVAYLRLAPLRTFLSFLSLGAVVIPLVFLVGSPVRDLAFPSRAAVAGKSDPRSTPVVMIVFDALPLSSLQDAGGGIAAQRYPAFARLARQSHWFRNATTVSDDTQWALPAIVTGSYPDKNRLMIHAHYPDNIFTLLADHYELRVVEQVSQFCPPALCQTGANGGESFARRMSVLASDLGIVYLHLLLPPTIASSLPSISSNWSHFLAGETPREGSQRTTDLNYVQADFAKFLSLFEARPLSAFYFLHVLLPHVPWTFSPSGKMYGRLHDPDEPEGTRDGSWGDDEWLVLQGLQRHLLQLGYADKLLGEVLERLDRLGLYDQTLIVVTADHGASFRPNDLRRQMSPTNFPEMLFVPLFIKLPGQRQGTVDDDNVETIDIVPTVAGVLGLRPGWKPDGQDALDESLAPRPRKLVLDVKHLRALSLRPDIREKLDAVRRIAKHFGSDWESLYRLGPYKDLVGRKWEEVQVLQKPPQGGDFEVHLEQARLYEHLDLRDSYLPTRILGTLYPNVPGLREAFYLAVAVNGEIRAVPRTVQEDTGAVTFSAMVPERSFRDGPNDVRIFVVSEADGEPALVATQTKAAVTYALEAGAGTIVSSAGDRFRIDPQAIQGAVWAAGVGVEGWAADFRNQRPAERIVVFADGEFSVAANLRFSSPSLEERFGNPRLGTCGFRAVVSAAVMQDPRQRGLRVFAVAGSVATEIPLVENPARVRALSSSSE